MEAQHPWTDERPQNYFQDCVGRPRPCPWVSCKYHLLVDVLEKGTLMVNAGKTTEGEGPRRRRRVVTRRVGVVSVRALTKKRPTSKWGMEAMSRMDKAEDALFAALHSAIWTGAPTCLLDVAEQGPLTLEQTGGILNITRERVRQLEVRALAKLNGEAGEEMRQAARDIPDEQSNYGPDAWERAGF